jgi:hypothetical protein
MQEKNVMIAHPLFGKEEDANIIKILKICAEVHSENIIPIAPFITTMAYLDEQFLVEKKVVEKLLFRYFQKRFVDEVWVFVDRLTKDVLTIVRQEFRFSVPVIAMSPQVKRFFSK